MKKIYKLMALSMLVLGLAACKKEETVELTPDNIKITTTAVTNITAESAVTGGNITDAGGNTITKRGVCWGEAADPSIKGGKVTEDGSGTGEFTSTISGFEPGKSYHVRAYAICSAGIAYGNDVTFSVPVFEPTVKTGLASDLGIDHAVVNGQVLNKMGGTITEVGVLFGTATNPTTKAAAAEVADIFSVELNGLLPETKYYVKAYAVNEAGTGYGEEIEFTTSADPIISVADENFQAYLEHEFGDENGDVHKSVADTITIMRIENQGIKTLEGIKQFPALKVLIANHNPLESIDVAGMANLELFDIAFNGVPITNLDLTGCTSLTHFWANDPADATGLESFTFELPALQELYLSLWRNIKTLDVTKSPNLRVLSACQMYDLQKLDLTHSNVLSYVWIPDIFNCTELKVASDALDYLGMWNAKVLPALDLSACPNLRQLVANDSYEIADFKINCAATMKDLNINCFRKITKLDLTDYVNLEYLNAIQLFACADFKLPTDLSNLRYAWLADLYANGDLAAPHTETVTFNNVRSDARILMWGCKGIKTINYNSNQEVIGWNYGDDPNVVTDNWCSPCYDELEYFNITAPNAKKLYIGNMHALKALDLKQCPNLEFVCMPDAWVMASIDLSNNTKLTDLWIWSARGILTLDLSHCAMQMNSLNTGKAPNHCANLQKIILKTGQTITDVFKEDSVPFEYVD